MAVDEGARHRLFQRLESVLGSDEAAILMEHLPPVGWADVVTNQVLDLKLESVEHRLARQISELRAELHSEMRHLTNRVTTLFVTGLVGVGTLAFAAARLV